MERSGLVSNCGLKRPCQSNCVPALRTPVPISCLRGPHPAIWTLSPNSCPGSCSPFPLPTEQRVLSLKEVRGGWSVYDPLSSSAEARMVLEAGPLVRIKSQRWGLSTSFSLSEREVSRTLCPCHVKTQRRWLPTSPETIA